MVSGLDQAALLPDTPSARRLWKAIRTALLSGVKPMQVAKHFGVSLATVR